MKPEGGSAWKQGNGFSFQGLILQISWTDTVAHLCCQVYVCASQPQLHIRISQGLLKKHLCLGLTPKTDSADVGEKWECAYKNPSGGQSCVLVAKNCLVYGTNLDSTPLQSDLTVSPSHLQVGSVQRGPGLFSELRVQYTQQGALLGKAAVSNLENGNRLVAECTVTDSGENGLT